MDIRKTFNFDEALLIFGKMNQLIEAGVSARSAAQEVCEVFGVSAATIRGKFQRMLSSGGRAHGNSIFTLEEEETLVGVAQGFSMLHRDLTLSIFKEIVKAFRIRVHGATKETNEWDPSDWLSGFLENHKSKLTLSHVARLGHERVDEKVLNSTKLFVEWFPSFLKEKKVTGKLLVNADETRILLKGDPMEKCITHADKEIKAALMPLKGKAATYIPFFNAVGNIIFFVYILPLNKDGCADVPLREVSHHLRGSHLVYYGFS